MLIVTPFLPQLLKKGRRVLIKYSVGNVDNGFAQNFHFVLHYIWLCKKNRMYLYVNDFWKSSEAFVTVNTLHYWSFMPGIHWWPVDSLHIGPVMWKLFPYHDIILHRRDVNMNCIESYIVRYLNYKQIDALEKIVRIVRVVL